MQSSTSKTLTKGEDVIEPRFSQQSLRDLEKIIASMDKNPKIAIGAPVLLNFYPLQQDDLLQEIANVNDNLIKDFGDFKSVKYIIGACEILRMEFFKKIGFFDEKIFLYYEDDEICHRTICRKTCQIELSILLPDLPDREVSSCVQPSLTFD